MNLATLKAVCAAYHQKEVTDLTIAGTDLFLVAANNSRKNAELLHNFELSRCTAELDIDGVTGGRLADAVIGGLDTAVVTGTLSPAATGTYSKTGYFNSKVLFVKTGATSYFLYYHATYAKYIIAATLSTGTISNRWSNPVAGVDGSYTASGANTGVATVVLSASGFNGIKEIVAISGLRNSVEFVPLDFTSTATSIERDRYELELSNEFWPSNRYPSDAQFLNRSGSASLVQRAGSIYHFPRVASTSDEPLHVYIEAYGWLNDYTDDMLADETGDAQDFLLEHGFRYLQWDVILELNTVFQTFVFRQEGNVGPPEKQKEKAWQELILWDSYMVDAHVTRSR